MSQTVSILLIPLLFVYDWIKSKYDLWYCRHFPHRIPFGEKWNRMLERLDLLVELEKKGFHFGDLDF